MLVRIAEIAVQVPAVTKSTTLVVDVSNMGESNSISLSSLDSYCHGEEVVRSSPASTILRPRSGKEYQKIERRRTIGESSTTSPLTTPQSPATGSVFTFDNLGTMSEQVSLCATSVRSECVQSPRALYMNLDFTNCSPPDSPQLPPGPQLAPAPQLIEQIEPTLNYAEIDLSDSGKNESITQMRRLNYAEMDLYVPDGSRYCSVRQTKKGRRTAETIPIEYSMIDMVATRAAQKARKDHAQSRDGSLRRDRFSTKERLGSLPMKSSERKHTVTSSAAQSSNSVNSANI